VQVCAMSALGAAGSSMVDSPACLELGEQQFGKKQWVTVRDSEWQVAPQADSAMAGKSLEGLRLCEMPAPQCFPGRCPISPCGFVSFDDTMPLMFSDSRDVAVDDGLALQKSDAQARSEEPAELHWLQEERATERENLEQCRHQHGRLKQKSSRYSDTAAFTVNTMDRIHGLGEDEFSSGEESDEVVYKTQADLMVSGLAAHQSLCSIAEENDVTEGDDSTWPVAVASGGHHGDASDDSTMEIESDGEAANKENTSPACTMVCWSGAAAVSAGNDRIGDGDVCSQYVHLPPPSFFFSAGSPHSASSGLSREPLRRIDKLQQ